MSTITHQNKRSVKQTVRIWFTSIALGAVFCLPFTTMMMAWLLGHHSNIGTPLLVLSESGRSFVLVAIPLAVTAGGLALSFKKFRFAGAMILLTGIFSWFFFKPIYNPFSILLWSYSYWNIPQLKMHFQSLFIYTGGYFCYILLGCAFLFKKRIFEATGSHGTATFEMGDQFLKKEGLILGRHTKTGKFLRYNSDKHLITIAPTRRGKGVSSIIPNIITYPKSLVVVDPKGENCNHTYKRRQDMEQNVFVLDPFFESIYAKRFGTHSFNPMDLIGYQDPLAFEFCNDIRDSIITTNPYDDDFWLKAAKDMYAGFLFYISQAPEFNDKDHEPYNGRLRNLTTVNDLLKLQLDDLLHYVKRISNDKTIPLHVKRFANDILSDSNSKKMLGSIVKTLKVNIEFMDSPRLRDTLRFSDFDLKNIINEKSTLYIIIPPNKIRTYGAWIKTIVELLINRTSQLRDPTDQTIEENRILFILDEFANLGRLNYVKDSYSIIAGYGMTLWTFVQDVPQLKELYRRDWQTFFSNSGIFQVFNTNDTETAGYVSEILGETTIFAESNSENKDAGGIGITDNRSKTKSISERARKLRKVDELLTMPQHQQIIKPDGEYPVIANKIAYYKDPEFKGLFKTRAEISAESSQAPPPPNPEIDVHIESDLQRIIYEDWERNDNTPTNKEQPEQTNGQQHSESVIGMPDIEEEAER